ncbi:uncharacterized protein N7496_010164 [Penicillium cataractarum]|uniref:Uncharacterized protein n=1 Tax=Penicillium cataractarum TaxID=2100454 RepID=A0A9W9V340_9EURO|nr:uncharacterized protein N7496_010164 [Penicillium cataractarum]KAJ5364451.1 hypothetical protein N7496_010164 [Penicillium cataractarum]
MSQRRGSEEGSPGPSRNQPQPSVYPPLNTGLIPRDYLGARSEPPGTRHISPSPLHTNSLPQSYRLEESPVSQSPLSPRSSANPSPSQNRSPISRIANAPFPAPPSNAAHHLISQFPERMSADQVDMTGRHGDGNIAKPPGVSEPDRSASSSVSSVLSAPGERPTPRAMPRTSSIDSAISSLSSTSQRSAFDVKTLSPADISNLITAAGSAEAVIVHLLKEKHQAASQNSQLWKLVDKQRTLILGLNKDLDRAFKEKEKYKKKLKELQDSAPPVPAVDTSVPRTILADADARASQATIVPSNEQRGVDRGFEQATAIPPIATSGLPRGGTDASPRSAGSLSSPIGSDSQRLPHPIRKPPPAPLNLRQGGHPREEIVDADSDSDYENGQIAEERSSSERGRRKTREEDDRDRETALQKDMGAHGSVGAAKFEVPHGSQDAGASASGNPVPRELVTRSPPNVGATGSLGSVLNSRSNPSASNGRSIASMPKSPGLPLSPRPEDRPIGSPLPRMPRDFASQAGYSLGGVPTSPRAVNYPTNFSNADAHPMSGRPGGPIPSIDPTVKIDSPRSLRFPDTSIYQGLVSDEYPGLLLPPNALPLIQVRVSSSRLRPSRNSYMASKPLDEEPVFTLSVISRSEMAELWRVEKVIASLPQLDHQIRQLATFTGKLPDRSIFSGHSPAKVDSRRAALNTYFDSLLDTPMDERAALVICQFLTNDAIEPRDDETSLVKGPGQSKPDMPRGPDGKPRKEGYLTKRGKNFGGWKARYFVLHGPELKYYESPGGAHMGTIKLLHAQIGKQSQNSTSQSNSPPSGEEDSDNQYRHAFLILEPKKKDSSALVRHVLCAEKDEERDQWVDALMEYVEPPSSDTESRGNASLKHQQQGQPKGAASKSKGSKDGSKRPGRGVDSPDQEGVQGFSFDDTVAAEPPILGPSLEQAPRSPRIPGSLSTDFRDFNQSPADPALQSPKIISGPTNGAVIHDVGAWGNKPTTTTTSVKEKKRSIWGFRTRSSFDLAAQAETSAAPVERRENVKPVFGIPLAEAVQDCGPQGVEADLPAVVYRCIEYLHAKDAALEEGIFRLSGSNVVIKALKERFNNEGDVDFLTGDQYYDVHAVASLFKQYLRELPTTVLTRELHLDFLRVLELDDKQKKLLAFNALVHRLPKPNLSLLRALSLFLIEIVNNSDVNKMTVRNVGIVFAPTLNIPAPVFSMFLTDFDSIFGDAGSNSPAVELTVEHSLSPEDIRSPRHQMFSDIPTPSYNQTSFRGAGDGSASNVDNSRAPHETGFIPMQPSYEQQGYRNDAYNQNPGAPSQYHSLNGMLNPNLDDTRSAKSKRRESSMLFMESTPEDFSLHQGNK